MKELLEQASKFLAEHPQFNEIELTDAFHNHVCVRRYAPIINQCPQYAANWPPNYFKVKP